ncbi:MAG: flagellar type III secretion system pore protein FliP [Gemmatales bacterium]|nr:flagellar type III secretion system pore protein FliP [Gemmatales bacterium]MCS7158855.1 flagellar type III secretion system pore protein FliP [Gemmatales bacterium]MDW8174054.1 flagellar type III secretion system pore protein FliP [Gemmatales bacterium]MDW8223533.1 flagellar type III secretion system pore protein FliP [Gemmatales bacterium]
METDVEFWEQLRTSALWQSLPQPVQVALFLGALTLVPAALVSTTAFTRILIVLAFVRRAVTSQDIPPNLVLIGLALFLTWFVMAPVWQTLEQEALRPYLADELDGVSAWHKSSATLRTFLLRQTRRQDLALFLHLAALPEPEEPDQTPFRVLIPAFIISELKTAFIMGFLIYLPFLLVDLVVASVLTGMGMVMMPPILISAPLKLLLFVLADGWSLVARALSLSFG